MDFDVTEIRKLSIEHEKLRCADDVFTFYYDESNNIRKLHLTNKGLNVDKACNFVLAGVAHRGKTHNADLEGLRQSLNLQKSVKEMKLKHLGKGSFSNILNSSKLNTLLKWLLSSEFYLHYYSLNVLYWSIIDIVDSIINELDFADKQFFTMCHMSVKSDLYKTIVNDEAFFLENLTRYGYPNIKRDEVQEFSQFLINYVNYNSEVLNADRRYILKKFIANAKDVTELFFIMDEKDHILISDFFHYYQRNIFIFKNSQHNFDEEDVIEAKFKKLRLLDNDKTLNNYSFVKSDNFFEIQISDVLAGLMAKYFTFISEADKENVRNFRQNLNAKQLDNLNLLSALIDKSDKVSNAFFCRTASEDEYLKSNYLLHSQGTI